MIAHAGESPTLAVPGANPRSPALDRLVEELRSDLLEIEQVPSWEATIVE